MRGLLQSVVLGLLTASSLAGAQSVERPVLKEGDKWVYNVRQEESKAGVMQASSRKWEATVGRVGSNSFTLARKAVDSNLPGNEIGLNLDWSSTRSLNGQNTLTSQPYSFPMTVGKTWKLETVQDSPDAQTKTQTINRQYTVIGWEDVKVPAGTFKALKIEVESEWRKEFKPTAATTNAATGVSAAGSTVVMQTKAPVTLPPASGRLYQAFWYAPGVKRHVKMVDESMTTSGGLARRVTEELDSFTVN